MIPLALFLALAPPAKLTLLVDVPRAKDGVDKSAAAELGSVLTNELGAYEALSVQSGEEINRRMEFEANKQQLGQCDAKALSCLAEIAGGMGIKLLVLSDVGKLGSHLEMNATLFESADPTAPLGRAVLEGNNVDELADHMPEAAATLVESYLQSQGASTKRAASTRIRAAPASASSSVPLPAGNRLFAGAASAGGALVGLVAGAVTGFVAFPGVHDAGTILPVVTPVAAVGSAALGFGGAYAFTSVLPSAAAGAVGGVLSAATATGAVLAGTSSDSTVKGSVPLILGAGAAVVVAGTGATAYLLAPASGSE